MTSSEKQGWKTVVMASLGSILEYYDFLMYGIFATELSRQFFPIVDPLISLISTFGVFALGYASRPLGGIILSSLGDRFGRKVVLLVSVLSISVSSLAIAVIPNYATIGIAAPLLLVALRFSQGFFLAGEQPCAMTYVVEEMPKRAGLVTGTVLFCAIAGILLASLASLIVHTALSPAAVDAYGWRIAFFIGGLIGLGSYWVRTSLEESPEFQRMRNHVAKRPFRQIITQHPKQIFLAMSASAIANSVNSIQFIALPSYLTRSLHYSGSEISFAQNIGIGALAFSLLLAGWLGDKLPSRLIHRVGCIAIIVATLPLYMAIESHSIGPVAIFLILGVTGGIVNGTYPFIAADLFPTAVRFSGIALAFNLATAIFTVFTPFAFTNIIHVSGSLITSSAYPIGLAVVSLIVGFWIKGSSGHINRLPSLRTSDNRPK